MSDRIIGFAEPSVRFSRKLSAEPNNRFPTEPSVWANQKIFIFSGTYRGGNSPDIFRSGEWGIPGIPGVTPKIIIYDKILVFCIAWTKPAKIQNKNSIGVQRFVGDAKQTLEIRVERFFYDVIFIGFSLVIVYCFRMWKEDDLAILCTAYSMIGVIVEWEIDHNFYALRRRTIELRAEDTRASRAILVWLTLSSENSVQSQDRNRSYWWNFSQSSYCFPATNHCTQGCLIVK